MPLTADERAELKAQLHAVQAKAREKFDELQRHAQATYLGRRRLAPRHQPGTMGGHR